jgi:nitric oxide reductase NorE protein
MTSLVTRGSHRKARAARRVPGETGVWIFILSDMTLFAALFGVFLNGRGDHPQQFEVSSAALNQSYGALNTLILLTSSLLVVTGMRATRERLMQTAQRCFLGAMACGAAFLTLKALEYGHELSHGMKPATNEFFMYFFVLTGAHAFHLVMGMAVLGWLVAQARRPDPPHEGRITFMEAGACYWHMVDLLWIVLFPLLYLVK